MEMKNLERHSYILQISKIIYEKTLLRQMVTIFSFLKIA
jgi:hypothetical protein